MNKIKLLGGFMKKVLLFLIAIVISSNSFAEIYDVQSDPDNYGEKVLVDKNGIIVAQKLRLVVILSFKIKLFNQSS